MPRLKKQFLKAQALRRRGLSLNEISGKLKISKSTASLWLRDFILSDKASARLSKRLTSGQLISAKNRKEKTDASRLACFMAGVDLIDDRNQILCDKGILKIMCALMYYCEGGKSHDGEVQFTNSDPKLIRAFLNLLRRSFQLVESKFRVSLHIHKYHLVKEQIKFWSDVAKIPSSQFIKPYIKPNAGKNIKSGYAGCVNIKYYDATVARELLGLGKAFLEKFSA
ncbi:MAG: hypothetical protein HY764_00670 [Candidatus Portnoybacteria bacterium]|nr:hypothetical protein [Candidatus Portnoybacteria bacterium]